MIKLTHKTINKIDLAKYIEKEMKCSRRISMHVLNGILKLIKEHLDAGDLVHLSGFGTFEARHRASHRGKSPTTGETFLVSARRCTVFKPGKTLKNLRVK